MNQISRTSVISSLKLLNDFEGLVQRVMGKTWGVILSLMVKIMLNLKKFKRMS